MRCNNCKKEFNRGDKCPHCGEDNHNYSIDWLIACENMIFN